jgi:hypothetical protein
MGRKIVQIAAGSWTKTDAKPTVIALCDDGTLWEAQTDAFLPADRGWRRLNVPEIPQD